MSMEVTSIYSGYTTGTYDSAIKKNTATKSDKSTNNVDEYYERLCKKFSQISINANGGIFSSNKNKIVLNLSSDCLKRMANDPTFAKKIENDISGIPAAHEQMYAKAKSDGIEIQGFAVRINADGSMQCSCSGSTRSSNANKNTGILNTKNQRQDRLEKIREKKKEEEKRIETARKEKEERNDYINRLLDKSSFMADTYDSMGHDIADVKSTINRQI